jgi:hypothetical protein
LCLACTGFLYAAYVVALKLLHGISVQGWSSLMVVVLVASGAQLLGLGIIGEYLWRNLDETRKRPVFLVEKMIGFDVDKHQQQVKKSTKLSRMREHEEN